jgi:uncharacterized protein YcfL
MRRHRCGRDRRPSVVVLVLCGLLASMWLLAACSSSSESAEEETAASVEQTAEGQPSRLTLSEKAVERLGIQTVAVQSVEGTGAAATTIPYSVVLYDADGNTWAFTNPEPLVYIRAAITVEQIQGDMVILSSGPPVGTLVVSVGAQELLGTEVGVGHE